MSLHRLRHPIPLFITLIVLAVQILTPLAVAADAFLQPAGAVAPAPVASSVWVRRIERKPGCVLCSRGPGRPAALPGRRASGAKRLHQQRLGKRSGLGRLRARPGTDPDGRARTNRRSGRDPGSTAACRAQGSLPADATDHGDRHQRAEGHRRGPGRRADFRSQLHRQQPGGDRQRRGPNCAHGTGHPLAQPGRL